MREPTYFVLASLLDGPLHGYGIIQRADELSAGRLRLATGTLYTALDRLTAEGCDPLERRCRLLLRAYPAWYRRERAAEMLGTLLEASPPGRRWPSLRDARALVMRSGRVRSE